MQERSNAVENMPLAPIPVTYVGISPEQSLIHIDGARLAQALTISGYPNTCMIPLTVIAGGVGFRGKFRENVHDIALGYDEMIGELKSVRNRIHGMLDGLPEKPFSLKRHVTQFLNPQWLAYVTLRRRGEVPIFPDGTPNWKEFAHEARQGFSPPGEQQFSTQTSIELAKQEVDRYITEAIPYYVGWILAHEYEHGNNFKGKNARRLYSTLPILAGIIAMCATANSLEDYIRDLIISTLVTYVSEIMIGIRPDEQASYKAGDSYASQFAQAIHINHDVLTEMFSV